MTSNMLMFHVLLQKKIKKQHINCLSH